MLGEGSTSRAIGLLLDRKLLWGCYSLMMCHFLGNRAEFSSSECALSLLRNVSIFPLWSVEVVSQQIGVLGGSTPCSSEGPGSFLQVILGYRPLRRQKQGDDAHVRPQLLSGASLKESRSDGRRGLLVRREMTARWQRSGFRAKARGGGETCLRTHPSKYTIMSGGKTRSASVS